MDVGAPTMEEVQRQKANLITLICVCGFVLLGCSSKEVMEDPNPKFSSIDEEYSKVVTVKDIGKSAASKAKAPEAKVEVQKSEPPQPEVSAPSKKRIQKEA